jgi:uncharacterized glyoxalase superfamily protein PhnB
MSEGKPPVLAAVVPILSVVDLAEALEFYQRVLGFEPGWKWGEPTYLASVCRDAVELNLGTRGRVGPPGPSQAYFQMTGVDAYYAAVSRAGAEIAVSLEDRPYGLRDFSVRDASGNRLDFGEPTGT